jgi:hypothetical protein
MSKLREQFGINDRLREYVERMLTVIIENNPQLLEVTTSSGVSIGSMGMSSMPSKIHQQPSTSTAVTTTENKSVLPQLLTSTESVRSDLSSTSTTLKQPADKYCRL